jgi:hypothetical protein
MLLELNVSTNTYINLKKKLNMLLTTQTNLGPVSTLYTIFVGILYNYIEEIHYRIL